MLRYDSVPVTAFAQNCSLLWCDDTHEGVLIDVGGDLDRVADMVQRHGVTVTALWLTHGHIDHAGGTGELAQRLKLPVIGPHAEDQFLIDALPQQAQAYGFAPAVPFLPDRWLVEGDTLKVGAHDVHVLHTPGHTPGHVVFHCPSIQRVFVGDVLFVGSIGRTDFPRGNHDDLIQSVITKLWPMGDDTGFICGHGPEGTLGRERQSNPFVGGT